MNIRIRYTFFAILIIIFLMVAPIVVLYTSGYRYNFVKNKVEKTGILVLDSMPDNALIFINEEKRKNKTETRIKNLLPDTYLVKIEREGYYVWEKFLEVKSKLTTFAENVLLFKKSVPMQMVSGKISSMALSNDKKTLAYATNNTLSVVDLKNGAQTEIHKNTSPIVDIRWSSDDKKILIEEKYYPHFKVVDISDKSNVFSPKNYFGINFKKLEWDKNNGNLLYGLQLLSLKTGTLYKINLEDKKTETPVPIGNSFIAKGDVIYTVEFVDKNDFLFKRSFDVSDEAEKITILPIGNYEFLDYKDNCLTLLHKDRGELVFINLDNTDDNNILETKVIDSMWVDDNANKLLIKKDFSILVHNFETEKKELITRYGEEIKEILWHPQGEYIFFSVNNNLQVIELDSRGGSRNKITLVNFDEIKDFVLGKDAEKIYFIGKVGAQEGLYELEIQ
ncbi:MAG: hypothetical protein U9P90_00095 [Patescibacteria group bacterium]|nr:hypothetical protein [Patescibacteria group bacterium]